MIFPDEFYLAKVSTRCLYFDKKSKENFTGVVKRKYKLAGINNDILTDVTEVYRFFVGTSEQSSCQRELTLEVKPGHWEFIDTSHQSTLGAKSGYFDVGKIDVLNRAELMDKMKDTSNGFAYVARLKEKCFGDLQSLASRLHRAHRPISKTRVPHILNALIKESDDVDKIMLQLGLELLP